MPLITPSPYSTFGIFRNGDINTIYPALFRRVKGPRYERERIDTEDGDFLDLDWASAGNSGQVALILHGLEASSQAQYVRAMANQFNQAGWDAVALNFRGCSGEPNRLIRQYHSGETEDLDFVLQYLVESKGYSRIVLVGFSLGGNVLLKYLGEQGTHIKSQIQSGIAISAPVDITNSCEELRKSRNWVYEKRFMVYLNQKLRQKRKQFPGQISLPLNRYPRNFAEFDGWVTAPIHGFNSAEHYWKEASSKPHLQHISIPTLLLNPLDDPFLGEKCYPYEIARDHPNLFFETPANGGHVGLVPQKLSGPFGGEMRALDFVQQLS